MNLATQESTQLDYLIAGWGLDTVLCCSYRLLDWFDMLSCNSHLARFLLHNEYADRTSFAVSSFTPIEMIVNYLKLFLNNFSQYSVMRALFPRLLQCSFNSKVSCIAILKLLMRWWLQTANLVKSPNSRLDKEKMLLSPRLVVHRNGRCYQPS